jgi:hypothetical protein
MAGSYGAELRVSRFRPSGRAKGSRGLLGPEKWQFLSPATNFREDKYGGSLKNRMRFCLEVIEWVGKSVGRDFTLGVQVECR